MKSKIAFAVLLVSAAVSTTPAFATVTLYTSRAAFEAAGASTNVADFEGLATGSHGSVLVQNGIRFTTDFAAFPTDLEIIAGGGSFTNPAPSSQALSAPTTQFDTITLATFGTFYAFGADFITNDLLSTGPSRIPTLSVSGPAGLHFNINVPIAANTEGFFGFRSDLALTSSTSGR